MKLVIFSRNADLAVGLFPELLKQLSSQSSKGPMIHWYRTVKQKEALFHLLILKNKPVRVHKTVLANFWDTECGDRSHISEMD